MITKRDNKLISYVIVTLLLLNNAVAIANNIVNENAIKDENENYKTVKLSPQMREEIIVNNKYNINVANILPYLSNVVFFDRVEQFKDLPTVDNYIENNVIGGAGNQFFAKGVEYFHDYIYTILRNKNSYKHPDTGENLGTEFIAIGTAKIVAKNKESIKMEIINSDCPIEQGDRLIPKIDLDLPEQLQGRVPEQKMQGYILDVENGLWDVGKYHSVLISLGTRDGIKQGHVLNILRMNYRNNLLSLHDHKKKRIHKKPGVILPSTKYGELIIYKVFDKVSLGIVVDAKFPITVLDVVASGEETS